MIQHRVQGISHMATICQCILIWGLFWIWFCLYRTFIPGTADINQSAYAGYGLLLCLGLCLESLRRSQPTAPFPSRRPSLIRQMPRAIRQTAFAIGFLLLILVLTKDRYFSRLFLVSFTPAFYLLLLLSAHFLPRLLGNHLFRGSRQERMILIGSPKRARKINNWLLAKKVYGFHTVGILTEDRYANRCPTVLGSPSDLDAILVKHAITQVILLQLPEATSGFHEVLKTVNRRRVRLVILSNLDEQLHHPILAFEDDGLKFFALRDEPLENPWNRVLKRTMDLAIAIPAILLVLPIAAIPVWLLQLCQAPGWLFYSQTRAGLQDRRFQIIKFRTMYPNNLEEGKPAIAEDPRIFPGGRFLRRFSLDELPQFLNVLTGKMSVVGPRPHLIEHNEQFAELLSEYRIRAFVKPGITGLAQVRGFRGEATTQESIAARLQSDLVYLENWSLILDCTIIARTIWQLFFPPRMAR